MRSPNLLCRLRPRARAHRLGLLTFAWLGVAGCEVVDDDADAGSPSSYQDGGGGAVAPEAGDEMDADLADLDSSVEDAVSDGGDRVATLPMPELTQAHRLPPHASGPRIRRAVPPGHMSRPTTLMAAASLAARCSAGESTTASTATSTPRAISCRSKSARIRTGPPCKPPLVAAVGSVRAPCTVGAMSALTLRPFGRNPCASETRATGPKSRSATRTAGFAQVASSTAGGGISSRPVLITLSRLPSASARLRTGPLFHRATRPYAAFERAHCTAART